MEEWMFAAECKCVRDAHRSWHMTKSHFSASPKLCLSSIQSETHALHVSCACSLLAAQRKSTAHIDGNWHIIRRHTPFNWSATLRGCMSPAFLGSARQQQKKKNTSNRKNRRIEKFSIFHFRHPVTTVFDILFVESREKMSACFCRRYDRISWLGFFGGRKFVVSLSKGSNPMSKNVERE